MLLENMVAQMLVCSGNKLFFYENTSRNDAGSRMELGSMVSTWIKQ